jgi:hypothetical protein
MFVIKGQLKPNIVIWNLSSAIGSILYFQSTYVEPKRIVDDKSGFDLSFFFLSLFLAYFLPKIFIIMFYVYLFLGF